jgi:3-polyprenyl-4-hydroxybenzoate decarboxylase
MKDARILLGVSGGIAAYKAAALTSALVQRGAIVDVVMTAEAERFVAPLTFASLTARPVYVSLWDAPERIPHIRLVREAQIAVVAPATANLIAKLAAGVADDLLTAALLAARIPVLIAPAMNEAMYEHPATRTNLETLRARGCEVVEPERGFLAERETGIGRLASEEVLLDAIAFALARRQTLAGKRVAITSLRQQRLDGFDRHCVGARSSDARRRCDVAARPDLARTAGRRCGRAVHDRRAIAGRCARARGRRRSHHRRGRRRRLGALGVRAVEGEKDRRRRGRSIDAHARRAR